MQKMQASQYLHINSFQVAVFGKSAFLMHKDFKRRLNRSFFIFTHYNSDFLCYGHVHFALLGW